MNDVDHYQQGALSTALGQATSTAVVPGSDTTVGEVYCALKMAGEAGEVAEKVGKSIRGDKPLDRVDLVKELGDVMWYIAVLASNIGVDLSDVTAGNLAKLADRKERGVLKGSGDDR